MTLGFGPDFRAALKGNLYEARPGQSLLAVVLFLLLLIAAVFLIQNIAVLVLLPIVASVSPEPIDWTNLKTVEAVAIKSAIVGMLPSALVMVALVWWVAGFNNKTGERGIPLHVPNLGIAGWVTLITGFIVLMWAMFIGIFTLLGIDPETYAANNRNSSAGVVEKAMADLADEPVLFALALPGVALGVPIYEELMLRGAFFAALRNSFAGKIGAVVITAACFALLHGLGAPLLFVGVIFCMGLVLGIILLRFGSVIVTIVCHACWNLLQSIMISSGVG